MKLVVDNFVRDLVRVALNGSDVDSKRIDRVEVLRALERLGASEELAEFRSVEEARTEEVSRPSRSLGYHHTLIYTCQKDIRSKKRPRKLSAVEQAGLAAEQAELLERSKEQFMSSIPHSTRLSP